MWLLNKSPLKLSSFHYGRGSICIKVSSLGTECFPLVSSWYKETGLHWFQKLSPECLAKEMLVLSGPSHIHLMTKHPIGAWGGWDYTKIALWVPVLGLRVIVTVGTHIHTLPFASVSWCGFSPQKWIESGTVTSLETKLLCTFGRQRLPGCVDGSPFPNSCASVYCAPCRKWKACIGAE